MAGTEAARAAAVKGEERAAAEKEEEGTGVETAVGWGWGCLCQWDGGGPAGSARGCSHRDRGDPQAGPRLA